MGSVKSQPTVLANGAPGFTLLEVMVALAIVALAVVALLGLHGQNLKHIGHSQDLTRATLLARELISQTQYEVYANGIESLSNAGENFPEYPGYRWERIVLPTELEEMRQVIVRVIWDERAPSACELVYFVRDRTA